MKRSRFTEEQVASGVGVCPYTIIAGGPAILRTSAISKRAIVNFAAIRLAS